MILSRFLGPQVMDGDIVTAMIKDRNDALWIGGTRGLIRRTPDGKLTTFDSRDGLPDNLVRALREDRDGNLWVGTNEGLSRLEGRRFRCGNSRETATISTGFGACLKIARVTSGLA